jgi:hypothetical protein
MTALCESGKASRYARLRARYHGLSPSRLARGGPEVELMESELAALWRSMDDVARGAALRLLEARSKRSDEAPFRKTP